MRILALLLMCVAFGNPALAQGSPISKAQLQSMFDQMRKDAPWNVDGPLLWGYYFTDRNPEPLREAAAKLQASGFRLVDITERASAPSSSRWWLHVEKIEVHSVDSLDARNQELYAFARRMKLGSYDGMDVGPAPK
jgi:hypothetical protein